MSEVPLDLSHLDHELTQLMALHSKMRSWRWRLYPKIIRRAGDVAYAAHLRVLLEFFHDGRGSADLKRIRCPEKNDLTVNELLPQSSPTPWTDQELRRLCDADKLLGHLSKDRGQQTSDWGCDDDWTMLRPLIDRILSRSCLSLPNARKRRRHLP